MILLLAALLQGPTPTVGDTLWITRLLGEVRGAVVRPQPWDLEPLGTQLGPAEVSHGPGGVSVRYPVVIWYPGEQSLSMPGPVVVRQDGTSDTLPGSTHRVRLVSVLPAGQPKARIPPRPPRSPVRLTGRSPVPVVVLLALVGLGAGLAALRWRRQGRAAPRAEPVPAEPSPALLRRWADLGEYQVALTGWAWRLARRMRQSQDLGEISELQRLLEAIAATTFSQSPPENRAALSTLAAELGDR